MITETMLASYSTAYGSPNVLEIRSIQKPKPKSTEVLVKVYASSVTAADSLMRQGKPKFGRLFLGLKKTKYPITGTGFSGEVVEVGSDVSLFKCGDFVFGETIFGLGSNTEYVCLKESKLILNKPDNLSFEMASTICDGPLTSYSFLKDIGQLKQGQHILINGASGSLGSAAVQLAKLMGAYVVGVCSGKNKTLVNTLGADEVIDYTTTDFTTLDHKFDLIYDTIGKSSYSQCKPILSEYGKYMSPVLSLNLLCQGIFTSIFSKHKALFSATGMRPVEDLTPLLNELNVFLKEGTLQILVDRTYALQEIVNAHEYVDTGRKKGNVVISMY